MEEPKIKAYGFNATLEFVEKNYDEATRKRILSALSPAGQSFMEAAKKSQWAPPQFSSELWTGVAREHQKSNDVEEQLVKIGRYQGAFATNTYLKLLMKMLTMKMFAKKFPDIWARDANFGKVIVGDLADIDKGKLVIDFKDLVTFPYFGPITQGWFSYSFEVMGLKEVKVQLLDWSLQKPDVSDLRYQVSWTR
jgi:hypothetical protein